MMQSLLGLKNFNDLREGSAPEGRDRLVSGLAREGLKDRAEPARPGIKGGPDSPDNMTIDNYHLSV